MIIKISMKETSQPIEHKDVINAYTKGGLYCVLTIKDKKPVVYKYPLASIFRVEERTAGIYFDKTLDESKECPYETCLCHDKKHSQSCSYYDPEICVFMDRSNQSKDK